MKSIILFLFVIGLLLIMQNQQKALLEQQKEKETIIEYRFIPRSIYEEQLGQPEIQQSFVDMFEKQDIFMNSPYR